jgi:hypothetical protein
MPAKPAPEPQPVYVYGVVAAGAALPLDATGVAERQLELVEHDALAAVVSDFPADRFRIRRRDMLAHLRSLEKIFEAATVAPCSFGTVMRSRDDVERQFLAPRSAELRRLLERLEGHVQMNVKAQYDEEAVLRDVVASDRDVAYARERTKALGAAGYYENIRLGELVAARLAARRARDAEHIESRLAAVAAESAPDPADDDELLVYKGSFLVRRDRLLQFDSVLEELAGADPEQIRFESFGPLPPTAFATLRPEE